MFPSFTDLYYFHEIATTLHFSRAAKKLNVTQPSLSIAIKRLENVLGTSLFIRHNQGVSLTRAGDELFLSTQQILALWEKTVVNVKATSQNIKGAVRIGCHSTLTRFMSGMISDLYNQYPGLEIHFQHNTSPNIMENILKGLCDIGVVVDPYPHADVILQQIAHSEMGFWVAKDHSKKFDLYAEETIFICDPEVTHTKYLIKQILIKTKHTQLKLNTMNNLETIVAMTIEGYGIGILPSNYTRKFYADKLLQIPGSPESIKPLCIAYRSESRNVKAIQIVVKGIKLLAKNETEA